MPTLGEIAGSLGLEFRGEPTLSLTGIAALETAVASDLSFVAQPKYLTGLDACAAGALILKPEWADQWSGAVLLSANPYLDYARVTRLFDNRPQVAPGVHPSAHVDPSATLGDGVSVAANAVIAAGAIVDEGASVGAGAVIGEHCRVGTGTRIYPGAVLYHDVTLGRDCTVHANAVIGADGFGFAPVDGRWEKILQLAGVRIGDCCEIGASTTIDRGALHDTVIGDDVIIDDQVHVAHGVTIGDGTAIAADVGIAGSTRIGKRCQLAGQAGLGDHIELVDDVHVAGQGRVASSIMEPGHYASGTPFQPFGEWRRNAIRFTQLETLTRRVRELEKALAAAAGDAESENKEQQS
jgi:UDP-3-O-[3-hydroxymyristoyl] glucosamine N-acyltransferase